MNVEVFNRDQEDAPYGSHVDTHNELVFVDRDMADNPSPRRDGFRVLFRCEQCDIHPDTGKDLKPIMWLNVYQHKGATFFTWEVGER